MRDELYEVLVAVAEGRGRIPAEQVRPGIKMLLQRLAAAEARAVKFEQLYQAATHGRREFRKALRVEREKVRALIDDRLKLSAQVAAQLAGQQREAGLAVLVERLSGALQSLHSAVLRQAPEQWRGEGYTRCYSWRAIQEAEPAVVEALRATTADPQAQGAALLAAARRLLSIDETFLRDDRVYYTLLAPERLALGEDADALRAAGFTEASTS